MIQKVTGELVIQHVNDRRNQISASERISLAFLELLEQQFPIRNQRAIRLRSASQFAEHLNIHVNHLNRAIRETMNKTTTQVISERILQEAKYLLCNSQLSVAEVAYVLGFTEATHFYNFFRRHARTSPLKFRNR